jgi:hypothetical protein
VLRVDAKFVKESFKLAIELWNSDAGKLLGRDRRDCPICDEQDLWGSAALLAQGLLDHALHEPAKPAQAPPSPPGQTSAPRPAVEVPPPARELEARPSARVAQYSGLALSLAGLAGIGIGAYLVAVDGESVGKNSDDVRDTMKYGLPTTIAGGVALLAGAGLLAWSFWSGPAKVSVGPSGVQVAGRF